MKNRSIFPPLLFLSSIAYFCLQLIIGSIDEIQKLHIQTIELGESPYRITYVEHAKSYAVLTVGAPSDETDTEEVFSSFSCSCSHFIDLLIYFFF